MRPYRPVGALGRNGCRHLSAGQSSDTNLIAAAGLGGVERLIGDLDELLETGARLEAADPDADGKAYGLAARRYLELRHGLAHTLGSDLGARKLGVGEGDQKLLAAVTAQHVGRPKEAEAGLRHLSDRLVADLMAVGVVDALEVIDVDHQQRELRAVAFGTPHLTS